MADFRYLRCERRYPAPAQPLAETAQGASDPLQTEGCGNAVQARRPLVPHGLFTLFG